MSDPKPTHAQVMAGYAVACKYGVFESRAFDLAEAMWTAMQGATVVEPTGSQKSEDEPTPRSFADALDDALSVAASTVSNDSHLSTRNTPSSGQDEFDAWRQS